MGDQFVRRDQWGARAPKAVGPALVNVPYGVVHHIGGGPAYPSDPASTLRGIQAQEMSGPYVDIAYSLGADQDGNVYVLRGGVSDGATRGFAGTSVSVLAICNAVAPDFEPTDGLQRGIVRAFQFAVSQGWLSAQPALFGHQDLDKLVTKYPTACPGRLEELLPAIRADFGATGECKEPPAQQPPPRPAYPGLVQSGSRGSSVRAVQQKLVQWRDLTGDAGLDPGPIDGVFGPRTDRAVRTFQGIARLVVDGKVGPVTWASLHTI